MSKCTLSMMFQEGPLNGPPTSENVKRAIAVHQQPYASNFCVIS